MRVVHINSVAGGSTGRIMLNIAEKSRSEGIEVFTFSENRSNITVPKNHRFFGSFPENIIHRCFSVITGISGTGSCLGTKKLLSELDKIAPDVLHLHNLHGWYINVPMLFDYIRRKKIKTIWTLHDCWGFTAQCSHFTIEKCEKWRTGCYSCPRYRLYPYTWIDRTRKMWRLKKEWFSNVKDLTIVTPAKWLAEFAEQSFLRSYPIEVINNGIDLSIFKPTQSDFRKKYSIENKKIILGVAFGWSYRKGLDIFIELLKHLDTNVYQIVLVGTDDTIDKVLPPEIISIHRTNDRQELAAIYSAADVFVNPTREETYPTVNMEAIACGTPVVTFDTGGCAEIVDESCGAIVYSKSFEELLEKVIQVVNRDWSEFDFYAYANRFDEQKCFEKYVDLILKRRENA